MSNMYISIIYYRKCQCSVVEFDHEERVVSNPVDNKDVFESDPVDKWRCI